MLSEIQFGGRITDPEDMVIMVTLTRHMFKEYMFQQDFELIPGYIIPHLSTVNQFLGFVNSLPTHESPESIHLHPNAEIAYLTQVSENMMANILATAPPDTIEDIDEAVDVYEADAPATGPTKEMQIRELCTSMLSRLPPLYNPFTIPERLRALGNLKPSVIFLRQEVQRISKLLDITQSVLKDLVDAIDGKIIVNEGLREAMDSIYFAKVPPIWHRVR
ncbi:unnamed protein product, partial [Mesocestoides corti]